MGFRVWGLWFGVWSLGFGVWGLGFGVNLRHRASSVWKTCSAAHAQLIGNIGREYIRIERAPSADDTSVISSEIRKDCGMKIPESAVVPMIPNRN